jgi:hypothetical protein
MGTLPSLQGASRTSGGIFRGKALGNVFNHGDSADLSLQATHVKGIVKLYNTLVKKPHETDPWIILKVEVSPSLGPILSKLAKRYSPVKGK